MRGIIDDGLNYDSSPQVLEVCSDTNWILESNEIKSTSGYIFTLGGGVVYNRKGRFIIEKQVIKPLLESRVVSLDFVRSWSNLTNPLTKSLNMSLMVNTSTGIRLLRQW